MKIKLLAFLIVCFALLGKATNSSAAIPFTPFTLNLPPTGDGFISAEYYGANTNMSDAPYAFIAAGYSGSGDSNYVAQFGQLAPYIAAGYTVSAATYSQTLLEVFYTDPTWSPNLNVYSIKDSWTTGQVTWDSRSTGVSWTTAGGDINTTAAASVTPSTSPANFTTYNWNVTALTESWLNGTLANNGLLVAFYPHADPNNNLIDDAWYFFGAGASTWYPPQGSAYMPNLSVTFSGGPLVPPPVPAASWLLDDGSGTTAAAMHGGSVLNGTFTGTGDAWSTSVPTVSGYVSGQQADESLTFNGHGNVSVPDNAEIDPASISVSAWVKTSTSSSSTYGIVQKGLSSGGYLLYLSSGKAGFKVQSSGGTTYTALGTTTIDNNAWHFVTGIYNASTNKVQIYVDGSLQTTTNGASMAATTQPLYIGGANNATANYFVGNIDEPGVYNYALSAAEVTYRHAHSLRPIFAEDYGALGNGSNNDTAAFQQAAQAVQIAGGGTIALKPGKTYIVGLQAGNALTVGGVALPYWRPVNNYLTQGYAQQIWANTDKALCIYLYQLPGAFCLLGQNSTMQLVNGYNLGAFDPNTGAPYTGPGGYVDYTQPSAQPYINILGTPLYFSGCQNVQIQDLTWNGNVSGINLGGCVSTAGINAHNWLCAFAGVYLSDIGLGNAGGLGSMTNCTITNCFQDGLTIDGPSIVPTSPIETTILTNLTSTCNGRNCFSWSGGNNLTATNCNFSHAGRVAGGGNNPGIQPPWAGMDIEAENASAIAQNATFTSCQFEDNYGSAVAVTATGNTAGITFNSCTLWADSPASWAFINPSTPSITCNNCTFYGTVENDYAAPSAAQGALFNHCTIADNPSPATYPVATPAGSLAVVYGGANVSFDGCTVDATQNNSFNVFCPATTFGPSPGYAMTGGVTINLCTVTHAWTGWPGTGSNPNLSYICLIDGATVTNTYFYEATGMPASVTINGVTGSPVIDHGDDYVGADVWVEGPNCVWMYYPVGTLTPGLY